MRTNMLSAQLALVLVAGACNGNDGAADGGDAGRGPCLDPLPLDCDPLYAPTFDDFYERRIVVTCGAAGQGGRCHGPGGAGQNGLLLADADQAYRALLDDNRGMPRVIPGDPECSMLVRRIESTGDDVMPPGDPLDPLERCSIRLWIANGAER